MSPNNRSRLAVMVEVTGSWLVLHLLTSSLVTWATYGIRTMRRKKFLKGDLGIHIFLGALFGGELPS